MTSAQGAALVATGICKSYRGRQVLRGLDLAAAPGKLVAILGENGSGKSTLLRILAGRERMDRGEIVRPSSYGYCPQQAVLYPHLTVDEHFRLFGCAYGLTGKLVEERAQELSERFAFDRDRRRPALELSGGTQQKLNLALALLHEPRLLLLDEPYAGLDIESYQRLMRWSEEVRSRGVCVVLVTHLLFERERERFDAVHQLRAGVLHGQPA